MKNVLNIIMFLLPGFSFSQNVIFNYPSEKQVDSLQRVLPNTDNDSVKMLIYDKLGSYYVERNDTISDDYFRKERTLARKLKQRLWEAEGLLDLSYLAYELGNYPESLQFANAGVEIAESETSEKNIWRVREFAQDGDAHKARLYLLAALYEKFGYLYLKTGNTALSSAMYFEAIKIAKGVDDKVGLSFYNEDLGDYYLTANKLDSAFFFTNRGLEYCNASNYKLYEGALLANIGEIYFRKGNYGPAKEYFFESIEANKEQNNQHFLPRTYISLSDLYRLTAKMDSAIYYARLALEHSKSQDDEPGVNTAYTSFFSIYKLQGQTDSAFLYLQLAKKLGDSLHEAEKAKISQYLTVGFKEQLRVEELEKERSQVQTRIRTYEMLAGIGVFVIIAYILYRNNRQKQKANGVLRNTLSNLKATQSLLVQSEKMASLGELTAGIAHEIQNPLNFVNNFSEVNNELIDELRNKRSELKPEDEDEILNDIFQNNEKISIHGKRADAIVKGMLQHSRTSSGQKEPTDINALCDEYVRLAYHGLRAKEKDFNAKFETDFDKSLSAGDAGVGKINIVPQDMGRVLLNLINNAFYAVDEKKKLKTSGYEPTVTISTAHIQSPLGGQRVQIKVADNGNGIPQRIVDKIFQPFFTTKPAGQGTGLGLSLSYDIVKAHGGEIKVVTKEGEGTQFTIEMPVM